MADIHDVLAERGKTHGDYNKHAASAQAIKRAMAQGRNWSNLSDAQREALDMFAHKIGRILSGDPNHADHWDDISGYATLVADRLRIDDAASKSVEQALADAVRNSQAVDVPVPKPLTPFAVGRS